jgi:hypothetical protein
MYSATDNSQLLRALCDEFEVGDDALYEPVGSTLATTIEVRTDHVENLALHRRLASAALAAIHG